MSTPSASPPYNLQRRARAYLGLGGNIGDVRATIRAALDELTARGAVVVARSSDYETPPWGKTDQQAFVNACALVETSLARTNCSPSASPSSRTSAASGWRNGAPASSTSTCSPTRIASSRRPT